MCKYLEIFGCVCVNRRHSIMELLLGFVAFRKLYFKCHFLLYAGVLVHYLHNSYLKKNITFNS